MGVPEALGEWMADKRRVIYIEREIEGGYIWNFLKSTGFIA
jgi:hypothetical protein